MSPLLPIPSDLKEAVYPFLVNSIEYVHNLAPARWGLSPHTSDGRIRLNVGFTEVLNIDADTVTLIVNRDLAKDVQAIKSGDLILEENTDQGGDIYASSPGSRMVVIQRGETLAYYLSQFQDSHHENIRITTKRGGLGRWVKSGHSNEAILEIAKEINRDLPLPLYSYDEQVDSLQDELLSARTEGAKKEFFSSRYERKSKNREEAKKLHGLTCRGCGFNFESFYGEHGTGYIQVHHLQPLFEVGAEILINPLTDLDVVCANCHVMIHRDKMHTLSLDELKGIIVKQQDQNKSG